MYDMLEIEQVDEYAIDATTASQIGQLLQESFPAYPQDRIYFRQVPTFRLIAKSGDEITGQVGIDFRIMNNDNQLLRTFGIVDLCVRESARHKGIAAALLDRAESIGRKHGIDFLILWAQDKAFYEKRGFREVSNPCRWLLIQNHQSHGLVHRRFGE
jgi:GNAT superfamily N-acetyltransferase